MSEFPALNKSTNPNLLLIVNALLENRKSSNLAIYKNKRCSNSCMTKNDTDGKQISYKGQCHEICCAPKTLPMATYEQDKTVLRICSFSRTIFSKSVSVIFYYNHISSVGLPPFFSAILLPPPKQNTDRKRRQVTMSDIFRLVRPD